jgi:hypothetical protein
MFDVSSSDPGQTAPNPSQTAPTIPSSDQPPSGQTAAVAQIPIDQPFAVDQTPQNLPDPTMVDAPIAAPASSAPTPDAHEATPSSPGPNFVMDAQPPVGVDARQPVGANPPSEIQLKPEQLRAMALLSAGKSIAESAETVGINRTTIYRWLNHDPAFKAAYNQWQDHLQRTCHSQLLMMTEKATAAVYKALEAGDAKSALQLLKGLGILRPQKPGPTDPEEVRREMALEKKQRLLSLKKAESQTAMDQFFIDGGMVDWELSGRRKR